MIALLILAIFVALLFVSAKRKVDNAVASVNAEQPDKPPLPVNSWADSGCIVLLLIVFVVAAATGLASFVPLP